MDMRFNTQKICDNAYEHRMLNGNVIYARCALIHNGPFTFICDLAVNPEYRGKGYGKQFMEYLCDTCNANCLDVDVDNFIAIKLYDKFGFHGDESFDEYKVIDGNPKLSKEYFKSTVNMSDDDIKSLYKKIQEIIKKICGYTLLNKYLIDDGDIMDCIKSSGQLI